MILSIKFIWHLEENSTYCVYYVVVGMMKMILSFYYSLESQPRERERTIVSIVVHLPLFQRAPRLLLQVLEIHITKLRLLHTSISLYVISKIETINQYFLTKKQDKLQDKISGPRSNSQLHEVWWSVSYSCINAFPYLILTSIIHLKVKCMLCT